MIPFLNYLDIGEKPGNIFRYVSLMSFNLIAFTLPFSGIFTSVLIIIAIINMVVSGQIFYQWRLIFKNKLNIVFVAWYLLHMISLLYSDNLHYALKDLETKLSILIFPLLVFCSGLTTRQLRLIFISFSAGCLLACIICLAKAFGWYQYNHLIKSFLYTNYSYFLHVTYFSFYLNFAALFILYDLDSSWKKINIIFKIVLIGVLVFFIINITQLNARTASFTAYITILACVVAVFRRRGLYLKAIVIVFSFIVFFGFLQYQVFKINTGRLKQITDMVNSETKANNTKSIRLNLWENALQLIKKHPVFGVGSGDIKEELDKIYKKNNFAKGILFHYSPHNQYIHTTVILGLVGLLLLLAMLVIPMYISFKSGQWLYFFFLMIILLNSTTESILEVQKGVIFYAFFNSVGYYMLVMHLDGLKIKKYSFNFRNRWYAL